MAKVGLFLIVFPWSLIFAGFYALTQWLAR